MGCFKVTKTPVETFANLTKDFIRELLLYFNRSIKIYIACENQPIGYAEKLCNIENEMELENQKIIVINKSTSSSTAKWGIPITKESRELMLNRLSECFCAEIIRCNPKLMKTKCNLEEFVLYNSEKNYSNSREFMEDILFHQLINIKYDENLRKVHGKHNNMNDDMVFALGYALTAWAENWKQEQSC